jgi:uncharacterized protein YceH (UPF0502 family)
MEPDAVEIRVLGCLVEKQRTTPDAYPLTLNSLRLACNQSTNRDPVVEYDESAIRDALERLGKRGWTRLASWSNRRTMKYRHLLDEALGLSGPEVSLLAVLMLRGPQTPGELKPRTDRLHPFADTEEVEGVLSGLAERGLAERLPRRPGERGQRWAQLLGEAGESEGEVPPSPEALPSLEERVAELEAAVEELRAAVRERATPAGPADR